MEEKLIQYAWQEKLYHRINLKTMDGEEVEVLDPGHLNIGSGPDFFNAKIKIGCVMWVGNVEIHDKASDWNLHGHANDKAYDNVILHVVRLSDCFVKTSKGDKVEQMVIKLPLELSEMYEEYVSSKKWLPCVERIGDVDDFVIHSWIDRCATRRLERKTLALIGNAVKCVDWDSVTYVSLARALGFGVNGDAMEAVAHSLPIKDIEKHSDSLFQVLSMLLGQAGLLEHGECFGFAVEKLQSEYSFLSNKFGLSKPQLQWKTGGVRPQNQPWIRLFQLSVLLTQPNGMMRLLDNTTAEELKKKFRNGFETEWREYKLGESSINVIVINCVVPLLFAYGQAHPELGLEDRAMAVMESLPAESNGLIKAWCEVGIRAKNAAESQGLIELRREFCDRRDCLRCRLFRNQGTKVWQVKEENKK